MSETAVIEGVEQLKVDSPDEKGDASQATEKTEKPTEKAKKEKPERKLLKKPIFLPDNYKAFIVDSPKAFDSVVKIFRQDVQEFGIISVDTESSVRASKDDPYVPIELLQIGTLNGRVFLFRLEFIKPSEINYIRNILGDPNIVKLTSLFRNDARRLASDWGIVVHHWRDVQVIARSCIDRRSLGGSQGLKSLTKVLTGVELAPFDAQQLGNWGEEELSDGHINYASRDVMAIIDVFLSTYANKARLTDVSAEMIKQHIQWVKFCNVAFFT